MLTKSLLEKGLEQQVYFPGIVPLITLKKLKDNIEPNNSNLQNVRTRNLHLENFNSIVGLGLKTLDCFKQQKDTKKPKNLKKVLAYILQFFHQ